jgi:hypothetical protein
MFVDPANDVVPEPDEDEPAAAPAHRRIGPDRFVARMSPAAWFFVLVAVAELGLRVHQLLPILDYYSYPSTIPIVESIEAIAAAVSTLLPAAVLFWRRDAWYSARFVLIGSILWTTGSAARDLLVWAIGHFGGFGQDMQTLVMVVSVTTYLLAIPGPLLILLGLERTRSQSRTTWPRPLLAGAAVFVIAFSWSAVQDQIAWREIALQYGGYEDPLWLSYVVSSAAAPILAVSIVAMSWSSASAWRAREQSRAFWRLFFAGSALIAASGLFSYVLQGTIWIYGQPPAWSVMSDLWWYARALPQLVGAVLLIAAFAWSARAADLPQPESQEGPGELVLRSPSRQVVAAHVEDQVGGVASVGDVGS